MQQGGQLDSAIWLQFDHILTVEISIDFDQIQS